MYIRSHPIIYAKMPHPTILQCRVFSQFKHFSFWTFLNVWGGLRLDNHRMPCWQTNFIIAVQVWFKPQWHSSWNNTCFEFASVILDLPCSFFIKTDMSVWLREGISRYFFRILDELQISKLLLRFVIVWSWLKKAHKASSKTTYC